MVEPGEECMGSCNLRAKSAYSTTCCLSRGRRQCRCSLQVRELSRALLLVSFAEFQIACMKLQTINISLASWVWASTAPITCGRSHAAFLASSSCCPTRHLMFTSDFCCRWAPRDLQVCRCCRVRPPPAPSRPALHCLPCLPARLVEHHMVFPCAGGAAGPHPGRH